MHPLPVTAQSSFGIDSRLCDRAAEAEYIAARANDISTGTPFEQVVRVGSFDFREGTRLRQATRTSRHPSRPCYCRLFFLRGQKLDIRRR